MRTKTKLTRLLTATLTVGTLLVVEQGPAAPAPAQVVAEPYTWQNVEIAGGGFVPGIIFNRTEPNLAYARTDIGGAYRWNEGAQRWVPLLDWVGWDQWGWSGVVSLATDPVDPDRVYVAAGIYTNDWDPNNGAILRSADRGASWQATNLPFKLGGNMPGRGMGERLAVDPNDNRILYLGAPEGNGLWRSTDQGVTWSEVTSFPNPGDYAEDPGDTSGYLSHRPGIVWVTFDERTGSPGNATQTIYAGVADLQNTVYRSTDGGASWERIPGQPTGFIAHKGVLDPTNGFLYLATSDNGGPYGGTAGDVWKLDTASGTWTRTSPMPSDDSNGDLYFGYSGLTIDRQNPDTLMVTGYSSWWPDTLIWRSTDGGATWSGIWEWAGSDRTLGYTHDISAVPWLTFGSNPQPPEVTPKLGWMTESLEIDPHNSDRMMYGTGATIYGTTDLTAWDSGSTVTIEPMVAGLEETAALDLISPPSGAPLLSALGDIGGFRHADLGAVPSAMFQQPFFVTTTSIDYAELNPNFVVRVGNTDTEGVTHAGFSADNGTNWSQASSEPGEVSGGGTIAAAADASRVVWSPEGAGVHFSNTNGSSWTASSGIPAGAVVESDRVNPNTFYGFSGGEFYVSSDGGASFSPTAATGLPSSSVRFKAVPGLEGDIWFAGGSEGSTYGLWHSTDSGASFTPLTNVEEADTIGFGAAAPGQTYPALYTSAQIDGARGIYRSDDAGATWVRINDDQHQWAWTGAAITGDPRVYGRVYVSTNGRGVQYGDPAADLNGSGGSP
jgi:xyloglucan-specific exo-beta-1,4-glucanase